MTEGIISEAPPVAEPVVETKPVGETVVNAIKEQADTAANTEFIQSLPEALRDMPQLKSIKGTADLATQFVNQQSLLGNSLRIPSDDAGDEAKQAFYDKITSVPGVVRLPSEDADESVRNEFYSKMGVPSTPNEYQVNLPEGKVLESEFLEQATAKAHALKLTNQQLNTVLNEEIANREQAEANLANYIEQSKNTLKSIWSSDYENRVAGASNALKVYKQEMPEYADEIDQMSNNPIFVKLLSDVAESLQEKGHAGIQSAGNYGLSVEDARIKKEEIMGNKTHEYHKGSQEAINYMLKLNEIIAGANV